MARKFFTFLLLFLAAFLPLTNSPAQDVSGCNEKKLYLPYIRQSIPAPMLEHAYGGCYSSWCQTGWYSSPAVANLDGDPQPEIIAASYSVWALDGKTWGMDWSAPTGHDVTQPDAESIGRTWGGVIAADLDADGSLEIATAHNSGVVAVYDKTGHFKPGWPKQITPNELRGLLAADVSGDGKLELIATRAGLSARNTWVLSSGGAVLSGWPQLPQDNNNSQGYGWGIFNANAAAADLTGDGKKELVVPSDVHYINAYTGSGSALSANPVFGAGKTWGLVGAWENASMEITGGEQCKSSLPRAKNYRPNFAGSPASIADLNGDGLREVVVAGNVYDCSHDPYLDRYTGPLIYNADRSRFNTSGFDWTSTPTDTGAPLSEDYNLIQNAQPNPVLADLDNDGKKEILYPSYDGRLHAFWLDKKEHGDWPYSIYKPGEGTYRFATEPTVADLDNDGSAEVIFADWPANNSGKLGKLHILTAAGAPLYEIDLPAPRGENWNGALAAPTLADVDLDGRLEAVLMTINSGVVVYDLGVPAASARILWGTGRANFSRDGAR